MNVYYCFHSYCTWLEDSDTQAVTVVTASAEIALIRKELAL